MQNQVTRRRALRAGALAVVGSASWAGCVSRRGPADTPRETDSHGTEPDGHSTTVGTNTEPETTSAPDRLRWRRSTDGPAGRLVLDGGTLYALTHWRVFALDVDDGEASWTHQLVEPSDAVCFEGGLDASGDLACVSGCDGLRGFSTSDGDELWHSESVAHTLVPAIGETAVYASGRDEVVAVDRAEGTTEWSAPLEAEPSSPGAGAGLVVVGGSGGVVSAFDAATGAPAWTRDTDRDRAAAPVVDAGTVYVGTSTPEADEGHLYALDDDGSPEWEVETGQTLHDSRPVLTDDAVYLGTASGELVKHDRADGTEEWRFETDDWLVTEPAVDVDRGVVYAGCNDGRFYAVDAAEGTDAWSIRAGYPHASPVTGSDAVFYAADRIVSYDAVGTA